MKMYYYYYYSDLIIKECVSAHGYAGIKSVILDSLLESD